MIDRAELGVDGNAGFALLGEDLQSGEAEFVVIDLPPEASKDPNRYHKSEWAAAAKLAINKAYRALKQRLADREFSYYLGTSHPDYLG
jgi:glutathione S-transferase